ncbi:LysE family translocator [Primorskyibacter marinus]|uniref:LysE family translocator n=1 Tax=Primorskyibacter marinus TaxID=1977320 RepID=UPI000E30358A|nr:LysE family translocator [Primorskyibacter marinus]
MDLAHVIAFNVTLLAAIASPGPAMLYIIRNTLAHGRRVGLFTAWGLGVMAATWTLLALLGLDAVFQIVPWAYTVCKLVGAFYLIHIAWKTWRHARAPLADAPTPPARAFLGGVLVNLSNPKSVLFSAAVLVVIFPAGLGVGDKGLIVFNHLGVEFLVGSVLVMLLSTRRISAGYLRAKFIFDRIAAGVMGLLGLRLLLSR